MLSLAGRYDTAVLVSGDEDFVYAVNAVAYKGCRVEVAGLADPGALYYQVQYLTYPAGTPLVPATRPFHDTNGAADVFWGASVHWNTYLQCYVMLLNRAKDDQFGNEGLYVSYAPSLADPRPVTEETRG